MSASPRTATAPGSNPQAVAQEPGGLRARLAPGTRRPGLHHLALAAVLVLSGVVNTHRLSQNGYGNIFYSAGDKSMLHSLHNFFFVSFDPGGLVTVDKPPLGLWVQAASAKLFGFAPLSLLLPEAILGMLAVLLLYRALARRIGGWAGVAGALALAVFPSFVAVSRTTNVDTLLIVLMILACDAGVRGAETGRWRTLIYSGVLVGLAFNTKTLAAYLVVPGIALAVLACGKPPLPRRLLQLLAAGLAMVVVSFAWMAVVEATPKSQRPYVGSSTNNTELGLTFSYNGFGRVGGQTGGPGQIPVGTGGVARKVSPAKTKAGEATKTHTAPEGPEKTELLPNGRARNPIAFGGPTGPLRLFGRGLGDQGAWLLPFALAGLLAFALLVLGDGRKRGWQPADRARLALLLAFGGWFVVEAGVLSLSKGIVHPYYVSALGPGVAAMVGVGAFAFAEFAKRRDWRLLLLLAAVGATVPVQLSLLHKADYMSWFELPLIVVAAVGLLDVAIATFAMRRAAPLAIALLLGVLVVAPAVFSASNWLAPVQSTFPAAGPRAAAGPGGYGVDAKHVAVDRALLRYVGAHRPGSRWSLLGDASNTVSPMILLGGQAGALGGFSGTDPVLGGRGLARLVGDGRARYVVLGGEFSTRGGNGATAAVQRACTVVTTRAWLPRPLDPNGLILFDCAGHEAAMSAS
jgi:4-amino-4-deoxy-L-arabinose transferase-like glycosyltransferase